MQASFPPYTVDFLIPELNMVIEADGIYGHLLTKDRIRDRKLIESGEILIVLNCKETTKSKIKDFLWRELNKLEKPKQ
jgi:very-short-patch-repair endonuclease